MLDIMDEQAFVLRGEDVGILFIHGFTGSPWEMKPMAQYFNNQGYTCFNIRLKGHCTSPDDLARYSDIDWIEDVTAAYGLLRKKCKKVFVCGISMGGSLGLYLAQNYGVNGVICMSTPIFVYFNNVLPMVKILKHFKRFINTGTSNGIAKRFTPGYSRIPVSSIDSLCRIVKNVKKDIAKVRCPVYIVQSCSDMIVKPQSAQFIYDNISSTCKRLLWLKKSSHNVIADVNRDVVFDKAFSFIRNLSQY